MKKSNLILFIATIIIPIVSCQKDDDEVKSDKTQEEIKDEKLSDEQIEFWDNEESIQLNSDEIILPNGLSVNDYLLEMDPDFHEEWGAKNSNKTDKLGPQDSKNLLIAKLTIIAQNLTKRTNFKFESEGENKPAQNGLAYSYGSRFYDIRQSPPAGKCKEEIYGLDCSGFIYQIFLKSGIDLNLPTWADKQRKTNVLDNAIKSAYPEMDKIKVEDLGKISSTKFETGDIIYWKTNSGIAFHIGIILKDAKGNLAIAQSNGSSGTNCKKNYGLYRGPRFSNLKKAILPTNQYGFGDNYGIVRINAEISGKWKMSLKCQSASFVWLEVDLDFPTSDNSKFTLNNSAIYEGDGVNYDVQSNFSYDKETNKLSCTFKTTAVELPSFYRFDSFTVKLERDDTAYFQAILGDNANAGCPIDVRLENKENTSSKKSLLKGFDYE